MLSLLLMGHVVIWAMSSGAQSVNLTRPHGAQSKPALATKTFVACTYSMLKDVVIMSSIIKNDD